MKKTTSTTTLKGLLTQATHRKQTDATKGTRQTTTTSRPPLRPDRAPGRTPATDHPLGQVLAARGWSISDAARRWGYTPTYLYRINRQTEQAALWLDAAHGIPHHDETSATGRPAERIAAIISDIKRQNDRAPVHFHVFSTGHPVPLAASRIITIDTSGTPGLSLDMRGYQPAQMIWLEYFLVALTTACQNGTAETQDILAILTDCLHDAGDATTTPKQTLADLTNAVNESLLLHEVLDHYNRLGEISTLINRKASFLDRKSGVPARYADRMDAIDTAFGTMTAALLNYAQALAAMPLKEMPMPSRDTDALREFATMLQHLQKTNLFREASIDEAPDTSVTQYDISALSGHDQYIFTLFRAADVIAQSAALKKPHHVAIIIDETPIHPCTQADAVCRQIRQYYSET